MSLTHNNILQIRKDFPNLSICVRGKPLVYLDNAATTFKPQAVIDAVTRHYQEGTSNVHRGVHSLTEQATVHFEEARESVKDFLGAASPGEIIFTRGTTEAINLVAHSYGRTFFKKGDEIVISEMEHHSNIVPWQILCREKGCVLKVIPINDRGELILSAFEKLLGPRTKLVSVVYISNSLGTITPVKEIIDKAHKHNIPVLIDGAQAVSHTAVDVQALDCDFFAFSGHKLYGPTGIGVLYGKEKFLNGMSPYQTGGEMIASVAFDQSSYNTSPHKFEAGTPHVAGVLGLKAAIDYVHSLGLERIAAYESELLEYATETLKAIPDLRIIGTAGNKAPIISFTLPDIHPHDLGTLVDEEGIAIRTGHHCTQPVMKHFNIPATARASLSFYNTKEEIDFLVEAIKKARRVFR